MNREEFKTEVGKYFLDVSKLIFGGVVLATIIKIDDINRFLVLFIGILAAFVCAFYGFKLLKRK